MKLILLIFILEVTVAGEAQPGFHIDFQQNDYNMTLERMEIVRYSKHYANHLEFKTFKYNRTCTAFNITINLNCDSETLEAIVQAYRFASNEYRLFPLRVQYPLCKAIAQNYGGMGRSACGNFSGCPMIKGQTYHVCNWIIDHTKLPPFIPSGQYKMEHQFVYDAAEVAVVIVYCTVTRTEIGK